MKKSMFLLALLAAMLVSGGAIADTGPGPSKKGEAPALEKLKTRQFTGEVSQIDPTGRAMTLKNGRGQSEQFTYLIETSFKKGRERRSASDLKPGMRVTVTYWEKEGRKTVESVRIP